MEISSWMKKPSVTCPNPGENPGSQKFTSHFKILTMSVLNPVPTEVDSGSQVSQVNETRMTSLAGTHYTKASARLSRVTLISFQEPAQLGKRATGQQRCQALNAHPGDGV